MDEKEQKVLNEINVAIQAIHEKSDLLEKAKTSQEAKQAEQKTLIEKACLKIDEIEVAMKRQSRALAGEKVTSEEHKAFVNWLRTGQASDLLSKGDKIEGKVLIEGDPVTGGYLTTPEMSTEMLKKFTEFSPIREIATVRTTSKESYKTRKRTGIPTGGRTGEVETRAATTGLVFGMEEIPTHEYYAFDDVSRWNLEDSDFDLEQELIDSFSEAIGVLEGYDFVTGNGVKRPEGFMTKSDVGFVTSGSAAAITADGLKKLYFAPKSIYVPRAVYVMSRATMLAASLLKEATSGAYLLHQLPNTPAWAILGARVVECSDMPSEGSNTYPVAFGDFAKAFNIIDRTAFVNLRDPFTQATAGAIRFWLFKRTGGQVVQAEAIYKLKCST